VKQLIFFAGISCLLSCNHRKPIVEGHFTDSLIANYTASKAALTNEEDLRFWQKRVDSLPQSFVNLEKYASALASRFHIYGDIQDLKKADSIMQALNQQFKGTEPNILLHLASYSLLQHRFKETKKYLDKVVQMKAEKYATQMMLFDAQFESGNYYEASTILKINRAPKDYAYHFRLSKKEHYSGDFDSAISHMLEAARLASGNPYLQQAALSNAADLYLHEGKFSEANTLYKQSIRINHSDFHSLTGLGWIALVHDKNDQLAQKIFKFIHQKLKSPDPLLKLSQTSELKNSTAQKKYAEEFVNLASDSIYGNMYNKYLIQLYTGILKNPAQALVIAKKEISNRATPQTYAWLAWCLLYNNQSNEAYAVYEEYVSGKPLEALELYWMGKLMKNISKEYNAQQFFKAAQKNKYDLGPYMQKDLQEASQ
jgi:hypothetical protein